MTTCNTEKLREIFARGLVAGIGKADGQTCIEGAIALACGGDLSDSPPCVAPADRAYSISINDADWPSPEARAEALLPLALAQVGTAEKDRRAWARALALGTIRRVLPIALRAAGLENHAMACEAATTLDEAKKAANAANAAAGARAAYYAVKAAGYAAPCYAGCAAEAALAAARAASDRAAVAADADAAGRAAHHALAAARAASDGADDADAAACLRESVAVALEAYEQTKETP